MIRIVVLFSLILSPFLGAHAATLGTQSTSITDVATRTDTGGSATVQRDDQILRITLHAVGLEPSHAYVLYLVVFNNPAACALDLYSHCDFTVDSNATGGRPRVTSTTVYLTGGVADADGNVSFNGKLEKGAVGLIGREVLEGTGIYNMGGAQLQVIIRDKGPWGALNNYRQTTEYDYGCDVNTCDNVQLATFE